jgi:hypothetical protein
MIDLDALHTSLPSIPKWLAESLASYAALALQRRHAPGVKLLLMINAQPIDETLTWRPRDPADASKVDPKRATEDAAECIALGIVGRHRRWNLVRRLLSGKGEPADWLAIDLVSGRPVVLEISGTDEGPFERRVLEKRTQARYAASKGAPAVSVVRFVEPRAMLEAPP